MLAGYYQFRPLFGKIRHNLNKVVRTLDKVDADLVVLPELAFTGYYFTDKEEAYDMAQDVTSSPIIDSLSELCRRKNFHIVSGFCEKYLDDCFNSSLLIGPGGLEHVYRKIHLFNEEKNVFTPGDTPLQVNEIGDVKIGIMVCFDWLFPEVTRTLALQGADIICHPSNLVLAWCQQTMITRCLENRVFAITANRYGADKRPKGELRFTGKSQVVAPGGKMLHRAPSQRDELYITEIDINEARNKNITPLNDVMTDRRTEFYM
ncbi:MAG: nitrilase-related carbon-nitrogen hydrolase [Gammaproteobacteria bacterium]|nr:nitrilase-related carbon-nitrogen hydrolase [Gammaproteobacteria bacterium]